MSNAKNLLIPILSICMLPSIGIACMVGLLNPQIFPDYSLIGTGIDAKRVFSQHGVYQTVSGADINSFVPMNYKEYAKDNYSAYYRGLVITGAQSSGFTVMGNINYAKDNDTIYYKGLPIIGVDVESFEFVGGNFGIDKEQKLLYEGAIALGTYQSLTRLTGTEVFFTRKNIFNGYERWGKMFDKQLTERITGFTPEEESLWENILKRYQAGSNKVDKKLTGEVTASIEQQKNEGGNNVEYNEFSYVIESDVGINYEDTYFLYNIESNPDSCDYTTYYTTIPKPALASLFQKRANRLSASKRTSYATQINEALNSNKNLTPQDRVILVVALYTISQ